MDNTDLSLREFIYIIPEKILFDQELSLTDIRVYSLIRSFIDSKTNCTVTLKFISKKLDIPSKEVTSSFILLEEKGYLEKILSSISSPST